MTDVRLPYIHSFTDRHGRPRYYFRHKGRRWPLPAPGDVGFMAAYEALKARASQPQVTIGNSVAFMPGTLGWAIEKLTASAEYQARGGKTKSNDRRVFDELRRRYGMGLLRDLTPKHVKIIRNVMREKFSTSTADMSVGLLSIVWLYADENLDVDGLGANPTIGIRRVHKAGDGHQPWSELLIADFMASANRSLAFAVRLALYTGQRRSDVVKMKWAQFDGNFIEVRQQKTGALLAIPCHAELRRELETMPREGEYILLGERGGPLTASSLSIMVTRHLRTMKVKGYSIHGLRKNSGKALAEAGCGEREIMAILGHRSTEMVTLYTKQASQKRLARSAMDKLELSETLPSGKPRNVAGSGG